MGPGRGRRSRPLYIETLLTASEPSDIDRIWSLTQDLSSHVRWDLRFTHIDAALDETIGAEGTLRRTFRYQVRLPWSWARTCGLEGTGWSTGDRRHADGRGTSALRFAPDNQLSPMGPGSGYWRYEPVAGGLRFLTGYDYTPGWGPWGRLVDPWLVRPLLGWATAWSFDRLRLWVDRDLDPAVARTRALVSASTRAGALLVGLRLLARGLRRSEVRTGIIGSVLAAGALTAPAPAGVPSARRCLRRPAPSPPSRRSP